MILTVQLCLCVLTNAHTGTFDIQDVVIEEKSSGHEITCYFAPGSQIKGCRIVIIPEGRGGDCELNTTATRLEGAGDAVVNVELPAGEYSVVVYDDEEVKTVGQENPAYTTTLSVSGTSDSGKDPVNRYQHSS